MQCSQWRLPTSSTVGVLTDRAESEDLLKTQHRLHVQRDLELVHVVKNLKTEVQVASVVRECGAVVVVVIVAVVVVRSLRWLEVRGECGERVVFQ